MSFEFNADEILEMAEQIERNGARFYRKAAELVEDAGISTLLQDLAAWEDGHERAFATMRADLVYQEREPRVFDPEHETSMYLRAMADGHVFDAKVDPAETLTGKESAEDILRMAIGQEKDSIVFYTGLKEMISQTAGRERIEAIIKEEMGHIGFLNREIAALKMLQRAPSP
ncbi:MAG: ferritin family protein [Deltaproteobacteria bacterium]|jgi:rubrerythrin|nr:ferritin family protein [Deltaproteobacteria bacterium]